MKKQTIIASSIAGIATLTLATVGGAMAYQNYQTNQICSEGEAKAEEVLQKLTDLFATAEEALTEMKIANATYNLPAYYTAQAQAQQANREIDHQQTVMESTREDYIKTCKIDARRESFAKKVTTKYHF